MALGMKPTDEQPRIGWFLPKTVRIGRYPSGTIWATVEYSTGAGWLQESASHQTVRRSGFAISIHGKPLERCSLERIERVTSELSGSLWKFDPWDARDPEQIR